MFIALYLLTCTFRDEKHEFDVPHCKSSDEKIWVKRDAITDLEEFSFTYKGDPNVGCRVSYAHAPWSYEAVQTCESLARKL